LYVDDILVARYNMQDINVLKNKLANDEGFGCCKENPWYENNKRQVKSQIDIVSG
jgi:hypothetical protein